MTGILIRREALRVAGGVLAGVLFLIPAVAMQTATATVYTIFAVQAFLVAGLLAGGRHRTSAFLSSMPICGRDLLMARVASQVLTIWLVALVGCAMVTIWGGAVRDSGLTALAVLGLISTIVVLTTHACKPEQLKGPLWPFLLGAPALVAASSRAAMPVFIGAAMLTCAVLLVVVYHRAPRAFQVAPELAGPSWFRFHFSVPFAYSPIARHFLGKDNLVLFLIGTRFESGWLLPAIIPAVFVNRGRKYLQWLLAASLSRRRLLLTFLAPAFLLSAVNEGGRFLFSKYPWTPSVFVGYGPTLRRSPLKGDGTPNVQVPEIFWQIGPGTQPVVQAPWGETARPRCYYWLPGLCIHNPFAVGRTNSRQFLEWQLRRATKAVYGREVALADIGSHRLYPLTQHAATVIVAAGLSWSSALLFLILTFVWSLTRSANLRHPLPKWRLALGYGPLVACLAGSVAMWLLDVFVYATSDIPAELMRVMSPEAIAVRLMANHNPLLLVVFWCAAPLLLYLVAERLFMRMELHPRAFFADAPR